MSERFEDEAWARALLDSGARPQLGHEARAEAIRLIADHLEVVTGRGVTRGLARAQIRREMIESLSAVAPIEVILRRARRNCLQKGDGHPRVRTPA